jgi:hypothetical protein
MNATADFGVGKPHAGVEMAIALFTAVSLKLTVIT